MRPLALALVLFALTADAAPIPPPRVRPRPPLAGSWIALWSGSEWPTVMIEGGGYVAERSGGPRYEGRWELRGHVLTIEERHVGPEGYGTLYRYSFTLKPGRLESRCGGLKLVRVR